MTATDISPPRRRAPARRVRARRGDLFWIYLFIVPGMVLTAMFVFYPMGASWYFSLTQWNGFSDAKSFVGLANYRELLGDGMFWGSFGRSMVFVLIGVPLRVALALVLAIVLNNIIRGRLSTFFRTVFFLPVMAAASVIGVVLTFVLSPSNGPIAVFLESTGLTDAPVEFLSDPQLALWSALLLHTWKNFGMTLIYWLAALQTVPSEYYEAAEVDGAGAVQQLIKITLPILIPFAVIIVILTANENLHAFALIQALTGGGPYYSSEVVEVYIFRTAFAPDAAGGVPRLGYASAAGCFFGLATLLIALLQAWALKLVADQRARLDR
ncbi:sugar ABC transporter permease [Brachybacterium vulturis]|uniref:Sugar ABC transporter permease n=1 Tax=Brachybacterium vulturis TaxID=2017484 RepID=A0A291GRQ3_9MICO|nr:sugar ABC transporter permease [Brachybacterium vulturis]ATG52931.1 sugar ABC transporter permease [Brachybacterium vulturis]